ARAMTTREGFRYTIRILTCVGRATENRLETPGALPMARLLGCLALLTSLSIPAATGAPLPEKPLLVLTAGNAAGVLTLEELPRDVWKVVWGPKPGELALVSWEKPVEVLDAANFRPLRQIGAGKKLIHFDAATGGSRLAWCENTTQVEVHDLGT